MHSLKYASPGESPQNFPIDSTRLSIFSCDQQGRIEMHLRIPGKFVPDNQFKAKVGKIVESTLKGESGYRDLPARLLVRASYMQRQRVNAGCSVYKLYTAQCAVHIVQFLWPKFLANSKAMFASVQQLFLRIQSRILIPSITDGIRRT